MAERRCDMLDVREMLRRLRLGESARSVARGLGASRNTARDYVAWFQAEGLLPGDPAALAAAAELHERLFRAESVAPAPRLMPYHDEIAGLVLVPLEVKVAWERFSAAHPDVRVSYTAFRRFVRRYVGLVPRVPGEEPRKTWACVMTLSHSRHQYVELVQDQTVATWLSLHRNAFAFLGGVPRKVVLDNLKAGIVKASVTDPEAQRAYRECAEHYGFVISPCVPRAAEHKGKVERGVRYLKRSFLAGRVFCSLDEANELVLDWVLEHAGLRVHGTTQEVPLAVFEARERPALLPLPSRHFELLEWKRAKLHPDCHAVFAGSYYSAPHPLIGQHLWVRATSRVVQLFHDQRLVATHGRALRAGQRVTNPAHLPPKKLRYFMQTPTWLREQAAQIGPPPRASSASSSGTKCSTGCVGPRPPSASPQAARAAERHRAERLRLLYVGFTRARDLLVAAARVDPRKGPAAEALQPLRDERGELRAALPFEEKVGEAEVRVGGRTWPCVVRELSGLPAKGEPAPVGPVRWFAAGLRAERAPERLNPSSEPPPAASEARLVSVARLGGRRALTVRDGDMGAVGDAIHGFIAADFGGDAGARRATAARLLAAYGLEGALDPAALLEISGSLRDWLEARHPGAVWHREWPVPARIEGSQPRLLVGEVDLLLELPDRLALVDHKSFPGSASERDRRVVEEWAPQLAWYAQALAKALGKPLQAAYVHLPIRGEMAEVALGPPRRPDPTRDGVNV